MPVHADVTHAPLDTQALLARVGDARDGAILLFLGVVRNHADGRSVSGMTYEAYREMAVDTLGAIAREASERLGTDRIAVEHRTGDLDVGEASVAIAVSGPHRAEAYDASRYVIEEIKKRLPVWKREHFTDGEARWVEGVDPREAGARAARPHETGGVT